MSSTPSSPRCVFSISKQGDKPPCVNYKIAIWGGCEGMFDFLFLTLIWSHINNIFLFPPFIYPHRFLSSYPPFQYTITMLNMTEATRVRVGKTALMEYICQGTLTTPSAPETHSPEYLSRSRIIQDQAFNLQLLDFRSAPTVSYGAHLHIIMFDITNRVSFNIAVEKWLGEMRGCCNKTGGVIVLVGNKVDLDPTSTAPQSSSSSSSSLPQQPQPSQRAVTKSEAESFAKKNEVDYYEISLVTGAGVEEMLETELTKGFFLFQPSQEDNPLTANHIDVDVERKDEKTSGCGLMWSQRMSSDKSDARVCICCSSCYFCQPLSKYCILCPVVDLFIYMFKVYSPASLYIEEREQKESGQNGIVVFHHGGSYETTL